MDLYRLTRQEAADELDISVRSIDRYIKTGKIRSEKK
jgi:predicted site-specific integrase-resolvase